LDSSCMVRRGSITMGAFGEGGVGVFVGGGGVGECDMSMNGLN
jgi:hypothetical protein